MAYRIFTDSKGRDWQAWDVIPSVSERRVSERRMYVVKVRHEDHRSRVDRRTVIGHRQLRTAGLDSGWLCFEATDEKRRLAPVPGDWERCTRERLEAYCEQATVARRASISMRSCDA